MKIGIIFDGNLVDIKGKVNAILNRIKYLQEIADYQIDVYSIQPCHKGIEKLLWGEYIHGRSDTLTLDEVTMNVIWYRLYAFDNIVSHRLHKKPPFSSHFIDTIVSRFSSYDLLSVHSFMCGTLALKVHQKFNVPYFITWHGSEIHSIPSDNRYQIGMTKSILRSAKCNFFVSKSLCDSARKIVDSFTSEILYNGIGKTFVKYPVEKRILLRQKYNINGEKIVAFVGNLSPVKNPMLLPLIFSNVKMQYHDKVMFWIIGDGPLKSEMEIACSQTNTDVKFWGNQPQDRMPDFMNCINVLVLPSNNESFGLVTCEALACGANAVGSRVGGIAELLGEENTFEFGDSFVRDISTRIVHFLITRETQILHIDVNWKDTAKKENLIYRKLLNLE